MEAELRNAGVDVDAARLTELAFERLRKNGRDPAKALRSFSAAVTADSRLLVALMTRYLVERATDMQGSELGSSHNTSDRQTPGDRDPTPSSRDGSSHFISESHVGDDRSALAPSKQAGGAKAHMTATLRPTRRPAPPSTIDRSASRAVARSAIFDFHLSADMTFGDLTKRDFLNLVVKEAAIRALVDEMSKIEWPADLDAPIRSFLPEGVARKIIETVMRARSKAATSVRSVAGAR